jgi:hypothetical protein
MDVVILIGGEHLIARLQWEAVVDHRQPRSRVTGERQVLGISAGVPADGLGDGVIEVRILVFEHPLLHRQERIAVEPLTQLLNSLPHGPGMGCEIEETEMDILGRELELLPDRLPVTRIERQCRRKPESLGH